MSAEKHCADLRAARAHALAVREAQRQVPRALRQRGHQGRRARGVDLAHVPAPQAGALFLTLQRSEYKLRFEIGTCHADPGTCCEV